MATGDRKSYWGWWRAGQEDWLIGQYSRVYKGALPLDRPWRIFDINQEVLELGWGGGRSAQRELKNLGSNIDTEELIQEARGVGGGGEIEPGERVTLVGVAWKGGIFSARWRGENGGGGWSPVSSPDEAKSLDGLRWQEIQNGQIGGLEGVGDLINAIRMRRLQAAGQAMQEEVGQWEPIKTKYGVRFVRPDDKLAKLLAKQGELEPTRMAALWCDGMSEWLCSEQKESRSWNEPLGWVKLPDTTVGGIKVIKSGSRRMVVESGGRVAFGIGVREMGEKARDLLRRGGPLVSLEVIAQPGEVKAGDRVGVLLAHGNTLTALWVNQAGKCVGAEQIYGKSEILPGGWRTTVGRRFKNELLDPRWRGSNERAGGEETKRVRLAEEPTAIVKQIQISPDLNLNLGIAVSDLVRARWAAEDAAEKERSRQEYAEWGQRRRENEIQVRAEIQQYGRPKRVGDDFPMAKANLASPARGRRELSIWAGGWGLHEAKKQWLCATQEAGFCQREKMVTSPVCRQHIEPGETFVQVETSNHMYPYRMCLECAIESKAIVGFASPEHLQEAKSAAGAYGGYARELVDIRVGAADDHALSERAI